MHFGLDTLSDAGAEDAIVFICTLVGHNCFDKAALQGVACAVKLCVTSLWCDAGSAHSGIQAANGAVLAN